MTMSESENQARAVCWVVTDGRAGIEAQALGLAEAVADLAPVDIVVKRIAARAPWRYLPWRFWGDPFARLSKESDPLAPPLPDLWIGCGRLSVPLTIAIKKRAPKIFTAQLQDPRAPSSLFDLVIPPEHDGLVGETVFPIIGSPNRLPPQRSANGLSGAPRSVAVLVGGPNRAFRMSRKSIGEMRAALADLADRGVRLQVTTSRRTPREMRAMLRAFAERPDVGVWIAGEDDERANPYPAMLADCDAALVTEDSVNMAVEAASTGRPVYLFTLERKPFASAAKFDAFHDGLKRRGALRVYDGALEDWSYEPLAETQRAAREVLRRWRAR